MSLGGLHTRTSQKDQIPSFFVFLRRFKPFQAPRSQCRGSGTLLLPPSLFLNTQNLNTEALFWVGKEEFKTIKFIVDLEATDLMKKAIDWYRDHIGHVCTDRVRKQVSVLLTPGKHVSFGWKVFNPRLSSHFVSDNPPCIIHYLHVHTCYTF